MRVVIIEDEKPNATRLKNILLDISPAIIIEAILDTVSASVAWFEQHPHPDVALMDIRLADGLSFDIFQQVALSCPVIFTTAYDEYAIRAFKVNSIDYLLKPIEKRRPPTSTGAHQQTTAPCRFNRNDNTAAGIYQTKRNHLPHPVYAALQGRL
jgi:DNA-binding LytR/AlgR family response regulator